MPQLFQSHNQFQHVAVYKHIAVLSMLFSSMLADDQSMLYMFFSNELNEQYKT